MPNIESRPISERIDLTYVKRKHWPQTSMFTYSAFACAGVALGALVLAGLSATNTVASYAFYSSGQCTKQHSMFANNCAACHVSDSADGQHSAASFLLPVSSEKCLDCHETVATAHHPSQRLYLGKERKLDGYAHPVRMSSDCATCHVEHQGYDYDLNRVSDATCTQCHADLTSDGYAAGKAPAQATLANASNFGAKAGHPEWAVLKSGEPDPTPYNFGHKKHNDPSIWPRMQEALGAIREGKSPAGIDTGRAIHVEMRQGKDGPEYAMSCTFCHETEADGGYMRPIEFNKHCIDCHKSSLGVVGAAGDSIKLGSPKSLDRPQALPHGSSEHVAELVSKAIFEFVAEDPPVFVPKPAEAAGEEKKEESGGGRRRRGGGGGGGEGEAKPEAKPEDAPAEQPSGGGRRRGGGAGEAAKPAGPKSKLKTFADKAALQEWMKESRTAVLSKLREDNCGFCHQQITDGPKEAPELFQISPLRIPDVWLPKSQFSHNAHSMVSCVDCHNEGKVKVTESEKTTDILLPGIESCQKCHAPQTSTIEGGAPFNCVLCHGYHQKMPSSVIGRKTIAQILQGGTATVGNIPAHPVIPQGAGGPTKSGKADDKTPAKAPEAPAATPTTPPATTPPATTPPAAPPTK